MKAIVTLLLGALVMTQSLAWSAEKNSPIVINGKYQDAVDPDCSAVINYDRARNVLYFSFIGTWGTSYYDENQKYHICNMALHRVSGQTKECERTPAGKGLYSISCDYYSEKYSGTPSTSATMTLNFTSVDGDNFVLNGHVVSKGNEQYGFSANPYQRYE